MILLITRDVFFASKVTGTAQQLGLAAAVVDSLPLLKERFAVDSVSAVILDLGSGIAPGDVKAAVPADQSPRLIAFGAHVDTKALRSASDAGFDEVLPRSRFSEKLPELLRMNADDIG